MKQVLIRGGYALAPLILLGTVAFATAHGRHRLVILALAVASSIAFWVAGGAQAVRPERR